MADQNENPSADAKKDEAAEKEVHVAKKGVKDAGEIVSSAGGEKIFGTIADITDGDR